MSQHEEYLRRNLVVCKGYGALAAVETAIARLGATKNSPKWLQAKLRAAQSRLLSIPHELAQWRDCAGDAP